MELTKYKVCPECGKHNSPNLLECRFCEADLTGVKILDSEMEKKQTSVPDPPIAAEEPAEMELVRICDCGAKSPPQARKCKVCGEDISDVLPRQIKIDEPKPFSYELKSIDGAFISTIDKPLIVVGREAEGKDYLADKVYVSRQHARFTVVAERVFIENLSGTNRTFINNEVIPNATPTALSDGDEIGLGGKVVNDSRQDKAAYLMFRTRK